MVSNSPDRVEEAARVAARWWREAIDRPVRHRTGDGLLDLVLDLVCTVASESQDVPSAIVLDAFEANLCKRIVSCVEECGQCYIDVDYWPSPALADAWKQASDGSALMFPAKTRMWVYPGDVTVNAGYGSPTERLLGDPVWKVELYCPALAPDDHDCWWDVYCGTDEGEARRLYALGLTALPRGGVTKEEEWDVGRPSVSLKLDGAWVSPADGGDEVEEDEERWPMGVGDGVVGE